MTIKPQVVSGLDIAFPAKVLHLMPKMADIPDEFKSGHGRWNKVFSDMFYFGVKDIKLTAKECIDSKSAFLHIRAIMGSFEPKHEHKSAACAYLMSLWFEDITYMVAK